MDKQITIAVDAMGGDNSPEKVIKGIALHSTNSKNIFYKIFGDENLLNPLINKCFKNKNYQIILYGATGFTGKLCAEYFRENYPDLNWAIAGRNKNKLEALKCVNTVR